MVHGIGRAVVVPDVAQASRIEERELKRAGRTDRVAEKGDARKTLAFAGSRACTCGGEEGHTHCTAKLRSSGKEPDRSVRLPAFQM